MKKKLLFEAAGACAIDLKHGLDRGLESPRFDAPSPEV
jgi:hypothetical protein